jgi:eukaryotic-like serine/threonine-protein kinase
MASTTVGFSATDNPNKLGRYEIVRRLAMGGMAEIYLARTGEIEGFKTLVVCKRILPHLAEDEQFINMFLDEARIASAFQHPNVIRINEVGKSGDEYYIAMELVHGEALSTVLKLISAQSRRVKPRLAAYIASQAAAGLHYAHTVTSPAGEHLGVVHRDVSPQNILVSFEGAVKVIDFGVARALNRVTQTQLGNRKGKVGYFSPEQASGKPVDARTDVFALGIVLWETACGRRLFARDNELETYKALMEDAYPTPTSFVPEIPRELELIIMKALEKDPDKRFESALAFQQALERFILRSGEGRPMGAAELARFMKETLSEAHEKWNAMIKVALESEPTPGIFTRQATPPPPRPLSGATLATSDLKQAFRTPWQRFWRDRMAFLHRPVTPLAALAIGGGVLAVGIGGFVLVSNLLERTKTSAPVPALLEKPIETRAPLAPVVTPVVSEPATVPDPPQIASPSAVVPPPKSTRRKASPAKKNRPRATPVKQPFKPNPF